MRYQDPLTITCTACDSSAPISVRALLQLLAICPKCGASLRDIGISMRRECDKVTTSYDAIRIIMEVEAELQVEIPDAVVEQQNAWENSTVQDLISATAHCLGSSDKSSSKARDAVFAAIKKLFPESPIELPLDVPLLDAIASGRTYGDSYR